MIDNKIMKLPGAKKLIVFLTVFTFIQSMGIIGQVILIANIIVNLWNGDSLLTQLTYLIGFFILFVLRYLSVYIKEQKLDKFASFQSTNIRNRLLSKIFRIGPLITQERGTGNITTMALEGVDQVEKYLKLSLSKMINMSIIPFLVLIVIAYFNWKSALFLLVILPVDIIFMVVLGYAAKSKADKQYRSYQILSNHFVDSLRGIDTLKFFGLSKRYAKSIFRTSENFRKATMSTLGIAILSTFALDFFTTLSIAIVAVFLGLALVAGRIMLFPSLVVLTLSPEYFLPIRDFSKDYHATLNGKNAFNAINEILQIKEKRPTQVSLPIWNHDSTLEVNCMNYTYKGSKQNNEFSFKAHGFQKIGVIGLSGAGKSTLVQLLSGFLQPQLAQIKINGKNITSFKQNDWQKQVIYFPQDPYIFHASLYDNITFYNRNASKEQVKDAIGIVGLKKLIKELPQGLDTQIGEGARALSGGQAQRIALARSFLDNSRKIILFDEPTAHLDIETEVELKEKMLPLMRNHLIIFATHRLHWMQNMDKILVLNHGKIVEQGRLDKLQHTQGSFLKLQQAMKEI